MKTPEQLRERRMLTIFNLTLEMWDIIFNHQKGCCGLCGKKFGDEIILVDHDHYTGQIRGLLCFRCNSSLGENVTLEFVDRVRGYLTNMPATAALGGPHYGLPGRVGTSMKRKRLLAKKRDKALLETAQDASAIRDLIQTKGGDTQ